MYRRAILAIIKELLAPVGPLASGLDLGAGDGWFAHALCSAGLVKEVLPVEVARRSSYYSKPLLYDGQNLPLVDRACELGYGIDALHHAADPQALLAELARVTGKYLLLKDHTYRGPLGYWTLAALDEIGNRRFGILSPHHYQRDWQWCDWIDRAGFTLVRRVHPARCHRGPFGWATNRLQFVALWKREDA